MTDARTEQISAIKEGFLRFLQMENMESSFVVAGRPIPLWDLWQATKRFERTPGQQIHHPSKFHIVGALLGLPSISDPQTGEVSSQFVNELQENYIRLSVVTQKAVDINRRLNPFTTSSLCGDLSLNVSTLHTAMNRYPDIDFSAINPDIIYNLLKDQFEARIRSCIFDWAQASNDKQLAGESLKIDVHTTGPPRQSSQSDNANNIITHNESPNTSASGRSTECSDSSAPQSFVSPNVCQPQNQILWAGCLNLRATKDGSTDWDILAVLDTLNAFPQQQDALSTWPRTISLQPVTRSNIVMLSGWQEKNWLTTLYELRAPEIAFWPTSQQLPGNYTIPFAKLRFAEFQRAASMHAFRLYGTINGGNGVVDYLHLFVVPNDASRPRIFMSRYNSTPKLGTPTGTCQPIYGRIPDDSSPSTVKPAIPAAQQSTLVLAGGASNPESRAQNGCVNLI